MGGFEFLRFSNAGIVETDVPTPEGGIRHRKSIFDITVTAEKQSPFSRAAQNETIKELYGMGLFAPENAIPALVAVDAMDFEGKDKIRQQIEDNAVMLQQFQAAMQMIQQMAMMNPAVAQQAMQMGLIDPEQMQMMAQAQAEAQSGPPSQQQGTPEERASRNPRDNSYAARIRARSANAAAPQ